MSDDPQRHFELRTIEFTNLYKEIRYHSDRVESIITLTVLYTGAFLGAILSLLFVKNGGQHGAQGIVPGLFLLPLLFILPSMLLVRSHLNSVVRIASYIQVFFEEHLPNEGIGWQKDIQGLRRLEDNTQDVGGVRFLKWALLLVWPALAAFCIGPSIFSIYIGNPVDSAVRDIYSIIAIIVGAATVWLTWICSSAWSTTNFRDYVLRWNKLKEKRKTNKELTSPSK